MGPGTLSCCWFRCLNGVEKGGSSSKEAGWLDLGPKGCWCEREALHTAAELNSRAAVHLAPCGCVRRLQQLAWWWRLAAAADGLAAAGMGSVLMALHGLPQHMWLRGCSSNGICANRATRCSCPGARCFLRVWTLDFPRVRERGPCYRCRAPSSSFEDESGRAAVAAGADPPVARRV